VVNPVQEHYAGRGNDAFVGAYNSSGTATFLSYWGGSGYDVANGIGVFLGGPGTDVIYGLAVGTSANARVTGLTNSTSGIATPGAFQSTIGGCYDAFLSEIQTTP